MHALPAAHLSKWGLGEHSIWFPVVIHYCPFCQVNHKPLRTAWVLNLCRCLASRFKLPEWSPYCMHFNLTWECLLTVGFHPSSLIAKIACAFPWRVRVAPLPRPTPPRLPVPWGPMSALLIPPHNVLIKLNFQSLLSRIIFLPRLRNGWKFSVGQLNCQ